MATRSPGVPVALGEIPQVDILACEAADVCALRHSQQVDLRNPGCSRQVCPVFPSVLLLKARYNIKK